LYILGISAFYHDSAVTLLKDGEIIFAAQEERFTRKKADPNFPFNAINFCLDSNELSINDIDDIVYYENPQKKYSRLINNFISFAPRGFRNFNKSISSFIDWKMDIPNYIRKNLNYINTVSFIDHHLSHASSAFFPSPFKEAAILTIDGVGEWTTASISMGKDNKIKMLKELKYPHSLGLLYSAFTYYAGFKVNFGEYKLMGLAPYGEAKYVDTIKDNLIDIKEDGSFQLNMTYFDFATGEKMINEKFNDLFGGPPRTPETEIRQKDMDIARSIQTITEEIVLKLAMTTQKVTKSKYLCLAGGVALNCVSNGKVLRSGLYKDIFIQPAAGDAGNSLGCALHKWFDSHNNKRIIKENFQKGSYLGPEFSNENIHNFLNKNELIAEKLSDETLSKKIASLLNDQKIIGLFRGKMEFGPRALGNRSIIGDPRDPKMQKDMNLRIKYRESFRPFAPSVLEEEAHKFFKISKDHKSPFMLITTEVSDEIKSNSQKDKNAKGLEMLKIVRSSIPAVTHVDFSARIQTVSKKTNPFYHKVIQEFYALTNFPVIINTSFNVRGEPIVCSLEDAYTCFMRTEIDYLVLGNYLLSKLDQKRLEDDIDWREQFELD
jgi:carbamoyltransferase